MTSEAFFYDRDFRAETAEHLRKLESDVPPAHDDKVARQFLQFENAGAGQEWHGVDAGHRGHERTGSYIEKDVFGLEKIVADAHCV